MMSFSDSVFARLLRRLAEIVSQYPARWVYPQIALFVASALFALHGLKFDMKRDNLIGPKSKAHQVYVKFKKEFPGGDELVVVVESGSFERNRQFIERLGARMLPETNLFADVFYKGDITTLGPKALFLASTNDLEEMRRALHERRPFIQSFAQATNLDSFFALVNRQFGESFTGGPTAAQPLMDAIPFLQRLVQQATASLLLPGNPPPPGAAALFGGEQAQQQGYITYDHGRIFLLSARARSSALDSKAIERIRALIAQTEFEVQGLNVGLTGEPVLDYDEMRQSEHDSIVASIVAFILCSLIFIVAYRQANRPIKAALCLIVGLGYAMGFTTLAVGHLNILTVTFAPMLIGLAIDFGVHFATRYEEEVRGGRGEKEAAYKATIFTGQGIVTGAMTTAAAFLAMALTRFKGIQEMGIICGGGLLLCLIPMMTLLPVLLMRGRQNQVDRQSGRSLKKRIQIENIWLHRPRLVLLLILASCAGAALQIPKVHFDYDLLHMQSKGLASVAYEQQLLQFAGKSLLFAAVIADSAQQALEYEDKIKRLPSVATVQSAADYFSGDQEEKIKLIRAIQAELADIHFAPADSHEIQLHELSATLWYLTGYLGAAADAAQQSDPALAKKLLSLRDSIERFSVLMLSGKPQIPKQLYLFQQSFLEDLHQTFAAIEGQDTSGPLRPQDLPPVLRDRFIGVTGKYLVQVYPKKDVWQRENQREFIGQLRSVVPEDRTTGTPIQLYEYTTLLKDSYQQAAYYALGAIALMVWLHFQSLLCVALSLLPVAIGAIWLLGFLGITGLPFNPANIMTLPLMIGIGVTNGIQILNRFAEEQNPAVLAKSTGKAVLVSGLTAIAGFASLILAKHQGIRSLGIVMSVGIGGCMIAGLTFLPVLLTLLMKRGWTIPVKKDVNNTVPPPGRS